MSDQEADVSRIKECARALQRVRDTFSERGNPAEGYGAGEIGSQKVLDAFDKFGSNWKIHRKKLVEELDKLHGITKSAADGYETIDHELAEALRRTDKPKSGQPGKSGAKGADK